MAAKTLEEMNPNNDIQKIILPQIMAGRLGAAITSTENQLLTSARPQLMERLQAIKADYNLLLDYWRRGYDDDRRQTVWQQLLCRLYDLVNDLTTAELFESKPYLLQLFKESHTRLTNYEPADLKNALESYVSDAAMLSLEPEHVRSTKMSTLNEQHQQFMEQVFAYLLTDGQWTDSVANIVEEALLSPTIDLNDQLLMVSGVMLSAMRAFAFSKFRLLVNVYRKAVDEQLRQRALVGWVFTADRQAWQLYPEMKTLIAQLCDDEQCRKELVELQLQIIYCMSAEKDTLTIQQEIMPDLLKHSPLRITRNGIEEVEENSLDEILHPEASEQNMERMEERLKQMMDMQKRGSDIYFGGFSQMKRYPFFNQIANWFIPFSGQHPAVAKIWNESKGKRFLHMFMNMGPFCDSDKYSFIFTFEQVLSHIPQQMLEMVEKGEATPMPVGGEVASDEVKQPAFIRRIYLQNLYRFFKIHQHRADFSNPFSLTHPACIFFSNPLFGNTALEQHAGEVAAFLLKQQLYKEAEQVLAIVGEGNRSAQYYQQMALIAQRLHNDSALAASHFREALALDANNVSLMKGLARALFAQGDYEASLQLYERIMLTQPDNASTELNAAVCMTRLERHEEALRLLYKLNYERADDSNVNRVLAWTLTANKQYEQAEKLYRKLTEGKAAAEDWLNYGFCLWFQKKIGPAIEAFAKCAVADSSTPIDIEKEITVTERDFISKHGIGNTEMLLMLDAVRSADAQ